MKVGHNHVTNEQYTLWGPPEKGEASHNTSGAFPTDGRPPHKKTARDPKTALTIADKIPPPPPEALERGLVATWAREFGYVSIHDPLSGSWHDVPTDEAPRWALGEAGSRKALWRAGDREAYAYNSKEMAAIWERERPASVEEGIVEEHTDDLD